MKIRVLVLCFTGVAGLAAGYFWILGGDPASRTLEETAKQSEQVFRLYLTADYVTAKESVLNHIKRLDQLSAESERPDRNPYSADAMIWYVRLAKLEEGNKTGGNQEYMNEARQRCLKRGRADCSEERLLADVDRMDAIAHR
jgi:hypothetical protein